MSTLPDFTLPSNEEIIVRLREATVADAVDFSEIDPDCEEEATSIFLDRLQDPAKYSDPRLWTGEDRRFALYMYKVNTEQFADIPLTYSCRVCEKTHTTSVRYADLLAACKDIEGKPLRDVTHAGHAIYVHPLLGRDLETIERAYIALRDEDDPLKARRLNVRLKVMHPLFCIDIPALGDGQTELERRPAVEKYLMSMKAVEFKTLFEKVNNALEDMRHGLPSFYRNGQLQISVPPVVCPNTPGSEAVKLSFPFHATDCIPHV